MRNMNAGYLVILFIAVFSGVFTLLTIDGYNDGKDLKTAMQCAIKLPGVNCE